MKKWANVSLSVDDLKKLRDVLDGIVSFVDFRN
jgi:hypothetical protein